MTPFFKKSNRRRRMAWVAATVFAALLPTIVIVYKRTTTHHVDVQPNDRPVAVKLEKQREKHTCGFHALSMTYRAYGLEPAEEKLRYRLGVDIKSLVWLSDSEGSLHPDIYMMLSQDHFLIETLDPDETGTVEAFLDHLDTGHLAILLMLKGEERNMHWVVAGPADRSGKQGRTFQLFDPLEEKPGQPVPQTFFQQRVVSALLIEPANGRETLTSTKAHTEGSKELIRAGQRAAEKKKS
ncbi:MAG: hypothetical protein AAF492_18445 [Verrucomicrobiota bacterium]